MQLFIIITDLLSDITRPKKRRLCAIGFVGTHESFDAVYISHVLSVVPDEYPPQSNARSLSNASTQCPYRPESIAALHIHVPGVAPSCISTFFSDAAWLPPITYTIPFSVTIAV